MRNHLPNFVRANSAGNLALFAPVATHFADVHERDSTSFLAKHFKMLLDVCKFIHSKGICHRDLRPCNLLFFEDRLIVNDFGCATRMTWGYFREEYSGSSYGFFPNELDLNGMHVPTRKTDLFQVLLICVHFCFPHLEKQWIENFEENEKGNRTNNYWLMILQSVPILADAFNVITEYGDEVYEKLFQVLRPNLKTR